MVNNDNLEISSIGETKGKELNINGVKSDDDSLSTIDFNNIKGFDIKNPIRLNIKNVNLTNANGRVVEVTNSDAEINLTNTNLTDNKSLEDGSAIYSMGNVNITSDNSKSVISNNYANSRSIGNSAIYIGNKDKTLTLKTINNGELTLNDAVNGENGYTVNITGDETGTLNLFNNLNNANVLMGNTTVNTVNNDVHIYNVNNFQLTGNTNFIADVDLQNRAMDRFVSGAYGNNGTYFLTVSRMNLLQTGVPKEEVISIYFAEDGLKNNVNTTLTDVAYSPVYKYKVKYDNREDGGYFVFDRSVAGSGSNNPSAVFNPAVLSASVSTVAASQATINETFKNVFEHADWFTKFSSAERKSRMNANKYAASTDFNQNLGQLHYENTNKAGWFKPYITFESMDLNNGPTVDAITYGSLAGFDSDFFKHKNGWYSVGTGYVGYNGSNLKYSGVDTTMNGGLLGYTHTAYKDNFWSALTISAGASVGNSKTMYGSENFTSLLAGIGSKTGYNFEFKDGKFILQPIMFMSYTFVNTFDYTNGAGVKIDPHSAHSIQLNPSVRFIANTKNGWQPYASVGVVWNVMNENKVIADKVQLPEISMKPYVEYGVGVQKIWKDKFTAYGQAMVRNGGRNGIALTGGIRWTLGKDSPSKKASVTKKSDDKKTDKSFLMSIRKMFSELNPFKKMSK